MDGFSLMNTYKKVDVVSKKQLQKEIEDMTAKLAVLHEKYRQMYGHSRKEGTLYYKK